MANQIIPDKIAEKQYSLNSLLEIGLFFKDPKNHELTYKDNWTFEKTEKSLRLWTASFKPNLKNASFEKILNELSRLTTEELTQTMVPDPLLQEMEKDLGQAGEDTEKIKKEAVDFKKDFMEKLKKSFISQEKKAVIAEDLSLNLSKKLNERDFSVLLSKTKESLPLKKQLQQDFLETWKVVVDETTKKNNLSTEENTFLDSLSSPVLQIVDPIETGVQIRQFQKQISEGDQKNVSFYQEKIESLKKQQTENIAKVLSSPFSPEKAKLFSDSFFEFLPDNLAHYNTEEATLATLWQMVGGEVVLKPEEVAVVFNNLTLTGTSLPKDTLNVLHLKDENGVSVFDQVKQQLLSSGININPESDNQLKNLRFQVQAIEAIYKGLTKEDLQIKVDQLLKSGLSETSPEVAELKGVSKAYEEILYKARESGFSEKQIIRWQKQALALGGKIRLPFSSKIKSWFLNTSLGKPIKLAMEKSAQKSLQALWTAGQEGIKKIAVPVFTKILTALGFGAKVALVGATNIVGLALLVVPKLIGKTKDFIKSIFSFGTGLFHSILSGIMGTTDIPEDSDSKWLKKIFIGTFVFIFFFSGAIDKDVKNNAFLSSGDEVSESSFPYSQYFSVEKSVSLSLVSNEQIAAGPVTVVYKIKIVAKEKPVTIKKIEDIFSVYPQGPKVPFSQKQSNLPVLIEAGQNFTYSYEIQINQEYQDSTINNRIVITADVVDGPLNEESSTSVSIIVGNPTTMCFVFDNNWKEADKNLEISTINYLAQWPKFTQLLCSAGPITLKRSFGKTYGGWADSANSIVIYDLGLLSFTNSLYTLAHESGHLIDFRNSQIRTMFIENGATTKDGYLCSYSAGFEISEDFAESIGIYPVWQTRIFTNHCISQSGMSCDFGQRCQINYPEDYPIHYNFVNNNIFN